MGQNRIELAWDGFAATAVAIELEPAIELETWPL
jgi:hypothetical protein